MRYSTECFSARLLALCAGALLCAAAGAEDAPQSRAARLRTVLDKVAKHGAFYPPEPPYPGRVTLEDPEKTDEKADYTVHIAMLYGAVIQGKFLVQVASLESRDWKRLPDGNWKMEQWQYRLTLQGEIERAVHRDRVENAGHTNILEQHAEDIPMDGPRAAEALSIYNGLLAHWDTWRPGGQ